MALLLAALLLAAGGVAYRVQTASFAQVDRSVLLSPGALAELPMRIGDWEGQDVPLKASVVEATDADAVLSRLYVRRGDSQGAIVYIAYGVRLRDLMPHRPEVCYPGAGWALLDKESLTVPARDGSKVDCRVLRFQRGGLSSQVVTVLDYYIVDGQCWPDVELLRHKSAGIGGRARYVAQIQITCGDVVSRDTAVQLVTACATEVSPAILSLLKGATAVGGSDRK